jgi:hypothetical protein
MTDGFTIHFREKFVCAGAEVNGKTVSWRVWKETRTTPLP